MDYILTENGWVKNDKHSDFGKYMYHICPVYRGKKSRFFPYIPRFAKENGENYRTKRICVSPSIKQCIMGIDGIENLEYSTLEVGKSWFVYRTHEKGTPAKSVCDFEITHEHWIKKETSFEYFGKLHRIGENDFAVFKNKKIIFELDY